MSALIKTNVKGYYKDPNTGAVINNNDDEYKQYLNQKVQFKEYSKTINEVADLKREMEELKKLLMERLNTNV